MHDYMKALRQRFYTPPGCEELNRELVTVHGQLHEQLGKEQRKLLLRIVDLENLIRDEASLYSFIAGFHLASGLHQELDNEPAYSFEKEEEDNIRKGE